MRLFRCVIAELFLEGQPLFELSQLLAYRRGQYDPSQHLEKVLISFPALLLDALAIPFPLIFPSSYWLLLDLTLVACINDYYQCIFLLVLEKLFSCFLHVNFHSCSIIFSQIICRSRILEYARWYFIWSSLNQSPASLLKAIYRIMQLLYFLATSHHFCTIFIVAGILFILIWG